MDSLLSSVCENNYELINRMRLYCLNIMRKRTIDEQLRDFSEIFNAPLEWRIIYRRTELEVKYAIASESATVKGLNETECVKECKRNFLHNLRVLCGYFEDPTSIVPESTVRNESHEEHYRSSIETSAAVVVSEEGPEDLKITTETVDKTMITVHVQTKNDIVDTAHENDVVRYEPFGQDRRRNSAQNDVLVKAPSATKVSAASAPRSSDKDLDEPEEHETLIAKTSDVLNHVTEHTLSENADALLDVLVLADRLASAGSSLWLVTDVIVKKAIRHPDRNGVYASLCSETVVKASVDPRWSAVADAFRVEMKMSCNSVLSAMTRDSDPAKARVRALETCRFMGRLFMTNNFKMSHVIKKTVLQLVESCDAHRLECLCGLLRIIGPRFEMVDRVSKRCSAERVYKRLENYAVDGTTTLPPRTVRKINRLVLERNRNWLLRDETATRRREPNNIEHEVNVPKKFVGLWESS